MRTYSFCGTIEYMAPEVVRGGTGGHDFSVDWWSVGVLAYELLTGASPFTVEGQRNTQADISRRIMKSHPPIPNHMSLEVQDFIRRLLIKDPKRRLGGGIEDAYELKRHAFFKNLNWDHLARKKTRAPFIPKINGELDVSNFADEFTSMEPTDSPPILPPNDDKIFKGYSYVAPSVIFSENVISDDLLNEDDIDYGDIDDDLLIGGCGNDDVDMRSLHIVDSVENHFTSSSPPHHPKIGVDTQATDITSSSSSDKRFNQNRTLHPSHHQQQHYQKNLSSNQQCNRVSYRARKPDLSSLLPSKFCNSLFFQNYDLKIKEAILGDGSFSVCRKCVHKGTGLEYAVKIVSRRTDTTREIKLLRQCQGHPNIVTLIEVFHDDIHTYIVTELLKGGELLERIRRKKYFTESEAGHVLKGLVRAVAFIHSMGIVHRDLKPEVRRKKLLFLRKKISSIY